MKPYPTPDQALSPEEDAALQVIEATEVKSIDDAPKLPPVIDVAPAQRQVIMPVRPTIAQPTVRPVIVTPPEKPVPTPTVVPVPSKVPSTPASQMADELAHAPKTNFAKFALLFFPKRKLSKKPMILIVSMLLVIGCIALGYFGWQAMRSNSTHKLPAFHSTNQFA